MAEPLARCPDCDQEVWVDGVLALVGPSEGNDRLFVGLLRRAPDGEPEKVAVKVLDVAGMRDWREHDRFRRQRALLEKIAHPRIPQPRGDFELRGRLLHCQTFVDGRSLAAVLRGPRLTPEQITSLAEDLLELLGCVHAAGIVHRDLKPENIVIDRDGRAHLVDFGSARAREGAAAELPAEPEPTVAGTPGFMAPELCRGELVFQSDLYALGKVIEAALDRRPPEGAVAQLLPRLLRADWRKRPASAGDALALLRPRRSRRKLVIGAGAVVTAATAAIVALGVFPLETEAPRRVPVAAKPVARKPAAAVKPTAAKPLEPEVRALVAEWVAAQNAREMERYAACYAPTFRGIRRTPKGDTRQLDRTAWLADRARMYTKPIELAVEDVKVEVDEKTATATVSLLQRFRRGRYAEHGSKRLIARREAGVVAFVAEEMLDSRRGWDEEEYARLAPKAVATCDIAIDLAGARFLVVASRHTDSVEGLRAVGKQRKARPAELVWGGDLGDDDEFWVVVGGGADRETAQAIADETGGEVVETLAPEATPVIALLARVNVEEFGVWEAIKITAAGGKLWAVGDKGIAEMALEDAPFTRTTPTAEPIIQEKVVRMGARDDVPHMLDDQGRWWRVGEGGLVRADSFDPDPDEGRVAILGDRRFAFDGGNILVTAPGEKTYEWPLPTESERSRFLNAAILRVTDDRLAVIRNGELFVFAIGPSERRMTKVCGEIAISEHESGQRVGAGEIQIGDIHLVTDRAGRFEVWTRQWGFVVPSVAPLGTEIISCGEDSYQDLEIGLAPLFGQTSLVVEASASCRDEGC